MENPTCRYLEILAWEVRQKLLKMFSYGKAHHFGGSFSCVELLTVIYYYKMRYHKDEFSNPSRDRFIMSKGHSVPTQYVLLSMLGLIPNDELLTIKKIGTRLQGHPDVLRTPGIEAPTGSLGMGLSYANGIAIAGKLDNNLFNIYVLLGDGELQEGQIWEAAMTSSHHKLGNICAIIDRNKFQSQDYVDKIKEIEPLKEKWGAFGWKVAEVDGHDINQICSILDTVDALGEVPIVIIADTIKGKGISFLENTYKYHNYSLTEDEYRTAEKEIADKLFSLRSRNEGIS